VLRAQPTVERAGTGGLRWWRAALGLELTAAHAGFPAGTTFLIGWAAADRAPAPATAPAPAVAPTTTASPTTTAAPPTTTTSPAPKPSKPAKHARPVTRKPSRPTHQSVPKHKRKHRRAARPAPQGPQPLTATPPLGGATRVFPVVGDVSWGDTYGGLRSDVSDGWHHGDDLFAPLGSPVVAVTDATVFSVGWNRIGGWRLWLIDRQGNEYYYAHLSGYTRLGKNNLHVRRGDVLGFVGNTGDAITTEPHLHFEIHPSPLLYLGYDGAVDPTRYLEGWKRPSSVKSLPPVALPGRAPVGWGSATDFRRLLALRPMKPKPQSVNALVPANKQPAHNASTTAKTAAPRLARSRSSAQGPAAPVVGLTLLACALVALLYTRREGRR
jgi:murein DD-endopeptidase MepM/ murein hydrolase activator NlpD